MRITGTGAAVLFLSAVTIAFAAGRIGVGAARAKAEALDALIRSDAWSPEQKATLDRIAAQRHEIAAEISRANPAVARDLGEAYIAFNRVVQEQRKRVTSSS